VDVVSNFNQLPDPTPPNVFYLRLFAVIIRQVYRVPIYGGAKYPYLWAFELPEEDASSTNFALPRQDSKPVFIDIWPLVLVFR
jgi:hypothetical protein